MPANGAPSARIMHPYYWYQSRGRGRGLSLAMDCFSGQTGGATAATATTTKNQAGRFYVKEVT